MWFYLSFGDSASGQGQVAGSYICIYNRLGSIKCKEFLLDFFLLAPPMKMELTECSDMSAHKIQIPANHPKDRIQQAIFD